MPHLTKEAAGAAGAFAAAQKFLGNNWQTVSRFAQQQGKNVLPYLQGARTAVTNGAGAAMKNFGAAMNTPTGQKIQALTSQGAFEAAPGAPTYQRVAGGIAEHFRNKYIGSPTTMVNQLREKGLGQYMAHAFVPRNADGSVNAFGTALGVGLPALQVGMAALAPKGHRGAALGSAIGSVAASPFTSRLGIPGQLLSQHVAGRVGGAVGGMFDRKPAEPPQTPAQVAAMQGQYYLPPGYAVPAAPMTWAAHHENLRPTGV